ncbi:GPI mannosyltransferase 2 [Aphidius gifuensis]|uniref:GPI mannosyltransferase 2 n=1 Tax=Aphidius gifuensis TaxID=684658 RepID=UPI001CDC3EC1|nr:GPI mannosyltransferase 2 [Aphidius gifuensis]XP_044019985.1 GPI mannosyltransferase 2 [Aphidius gifuensis]
MYEARRKVLWFAIISRLSIIFMQMIFNSLCPDHESDGFITPKDPTINSSFADNMINYSLSGLARWDSNYFLHIAKYGYTYENTLAFFPLYPMSIRFLSKIIRKLFFFINEDSVFLLSGVTISFICFVKSSIILYDLTRYIFKDKNIAYKSAILYCISPANIFLTSVYSESMFAYFTFSGMLASMKNDPFVSLPIGLSSIIRSNGLINIGYPIYIFIQEFIFFKIPNIIYEIKSHSIKSSIPSIINIIGCLLNILCTILLSFAPFCLLQTYNYVQFCTEKTNSTIIPKHVIEYGINNDLILSGSKLSPWCTSTIPIAYTYVQKKYWNVGLFNYYEIKQLPNFFLAIPIIYIMLKCTFDYCLENKKNLFMLKFYHHNINNINSNNRRNTRFKKYTNDMLPFVIHGLFLTIFCILFVHIQVSTRLLSSASPILYWYCAISMSKKFTDDYDERQNIHSKWKVFFMTQKRYTKSDKLILIYFIGYTIFGTFMFSNFLPWT